jgi:nicotinate-nucleotide adenylyltransferase
MQVGILGGTFDPVHLAHLVVAEEARTSLGLSRVLFVPAGEPWLKDGLALSSAEHRVNMLRLAVEDNPHFQVSLVEVQRPGPSYTVDTLETVLAELGPATSLHFILGVDALEEFHRWKEPAQILAMASLVVVRRPGRQKFDWPAFFTRLPQAAGKVRLLEAPVLDISGTEIRQRSEAGASLRYLVPSKVEEYIKAHGVYLRGQGESGASALSPDEIGAIPTGRDAEGPVRRRRIGENDTASQLLRVAVERGALKYGDFTLTSGRKSSYYFDGRLLSLDPEGADLIARALLPIVRESRADAVGGPTLGADPIVAAVALASYREGRRIPGFIVRKETKAHGMAQAIEGPLPPGCRVVIVDDTCTTGGSLLHAIAAAEAAGCTVVKVIALLDRREGGGDELRRRGYDFVALMAASPDGKIEVCVPSTGEA